MEWQSAHWIPTDLGLPAFIEETFHADHRVQLQKRQRRPRIIEIDLAGAQSFEQIIGERPAIDLEAKIQRRVGRKTRTHAAQGRARDRLVQAERVAPERFVAEGVEAERLPPLDEHLYRTLRVGPDLRAQDQDCCRSALAADRIFPLRHSGQSWR